MKYAFWLIWIANTICLAQSNIFLDSELGKLIAEPVSDTFMVPYGLVFLPNGNMLVSDRFYGTMYTLNPLTKKRTLIKNLPKVSGQAFGGMMDIALHPDYKKNGWIYFNYTIKKDSLYTMVLDRARIKANIMVDRQRLFQASPGYIEEGHFGSSIAVKDGFVYFSMGDFYELKDSAQSLSNHLGKILRLHDDGRVPGDNPFVGNRGAKPEIWSLGHRNPQGLAFYPGTNQLYEHEHGPKGGDEINLIQPGKNYGWPIICHGKDYDGQPIGEGIKEKKGLEQPLYFYVPSIAPCGISFYTGSVFPQWKNSLFIGAMALKHVNRVEIENGKVIHEERLFTDQKWRVRSIKEGPDGFLYIGVDKGYILRIRPANTIIKNMNIIYESRHFIVEVPSFPLIDRADGGHIVINPKVRVSDLPTLTNVQAIELMQLIRVAGKAMEITMNKQGVDIGRINYQDNGNWGVFLPEGPYQHFHIYGRAKSAKKQPYGQSLFFPHKNENPDFYKDNLPLTPEDIIAIRKQMEELVKQKEYRFSDS